MADHRPPLSSSPSYSSEHYGDPFADRPRQTRFTEAEGSPFQSTTSLSLGDRDAYDDEEAIEKQPLTVGQNFSGGFYPPA